MFTSSVRGDRPAVLENLTTGRQNPVQEGRPGGREVSAVKQGVPS